MANYVVAALSGAITGALLWGGGVLILSYSSLGERYPPEGFWKTLWRPLYAWVWAAGRGLALMWRNLALVIGIVWLAQVPLQLWAFSVSHDWVNAALAGFYAVGAYYFWRSQKAIWALKAKRQESMRSGPPSLSSYRNQPSPITSFSLIPTSGKLSPNKSRKKSPPDGPVVGFRVWKWGTGFGGGVSLVAINPEYGRWEPGVNLATCNRDIGAPVADRHRAPYSNCGCGFWLKSTLPAAHAKLHHMYLLGVAMGWGHVIEHEDGWRVQYASVVALSDAGMDLFSLEGRVAMRSYLEKLAMTYEVPVLPLLELGQYQEGSNPRSLAIAMGLLRFVCSACHYEYKTSFANLHGMPCFAPIALKGEPCLGEMRFVE